MIALWQTTNGGCKYGKLESGRKEGSTEGKEGRKKRQIGGRE